MLPRFAARTVEYIQASNFASIELLIYRKQASEAPVRGKASLMRRLVRRVFDSNLRKHTLFNIYMNWDRRRKPQDYPRDLVNCAALLEGIEEIEVEPIGKKFVQRFPSDALDQIRARNLDVLIRFGFNILKGDILTSARYGVWSFHHGDNDFYRGGPALFWEIYERHPLSGVILQVLTEELDAGTVLCKSLFATQKTLSLSANSYGPYWGAADLIIRKLNELHRFGWEHVQQNSLPSSPYQGKRRLYRTPTNLEMLRWLAPVVVKKTLHRPFRKRTVQHWRIAVRTGARPLYDRASDHSLQGFRWIDSPREHFWADPFLIEQEGRPWLFFEDYDYSSRRGLIACAQISDNGVSEPATCLASPDHHYSYPYIFRAGSELFMVPESADSGSVDLYQCEEFPRKWRKRSTLLRGKFVDPSIWEQDGLWWLMVTAVDPDPRSASLYLFYAKTLEGNWNLHPCNPISTDVRNNRGAGTILHVDGRLIRPSQSCAPIYGYSFTLNQVTTLSPTEYKEVPLREFTPECVGVDAVHTYNAIPGIEVIDGAKSTSRSKV